MNLLISIKTGKNKFIVLNENDQNLFEKEVYELGVKYFDKIQLKIKEI